MANKLKLGIQLFTLREYTKTEEDYERTMHKCAEIGYKYAQNSSIGGDIRPEFIAKVERDTGMQIYLTHTGPDEILNNPEKVIEYHQIIGCKGVGMGTSPCSHGEENYKRLADRINKVSDLYKKAGMTILYHNHRWEFCRCSDNQRGLDVILNNTDKDAVKLTFDAYWAAYSGYDPALFLRQYKDRIFCTHLKDLAIVLTKNEGGHTCDEVRMTELLTGNMNYDGFMQAALDTGIYYHFVEQDTVYMDPFESIKISHNNMKARYPMD